MSSSKLIADIASGSITSAQAVTNCFDAIKSRDDEINAFLSTDVEAALTQAEAIDQRRTNGEVLGPLAGVPVAIKDNVCTEGMATTCASRMLDGFVPPYDAHVVAKLKAAGAIIIGKTNLDEFAMGSSTENSAFGPTRNPVDTERSPGGSSGGSAAAVAAGFTPLSIGSDTGGSIRQPAAFCGVVGMKPTYGRVSRYGLVAFASSLDQIGPFATDVTSAAQLLNVLAGYDERDSTSVDCEVPNYTSDIDEPLSGLRIGVAKEHMVEGLSDSVRIRFEAALDAYKSAGATVTEVSLPHSKYSVAAYYLIAPSEASSNLARYDGIHYGKRAKEYNDLVDLYATSRAEGFGDEVKRRIMLGTYSLSAGYYDAYYNKALKVRRLIRQDYDAAFETVDTILSPVTPTPAFKLGELVDDPLAMYLSDIYTISANLAGLPAISIPAGTDPNGLPIGVQLTAPAFEETKLFRSARMLELGLEGR
ncbi:MAG: Asp-tRNA(Asn)/Glu-tRNA(Gln) amidotransferase subunit GatA [Planctomycetaceae bacterium]